MNTPVHSWPDVSACAVITKAYISAILKELVDSSLCSLVSRLGLTSANTWSVILSTLGWNFAFVERRKQRRKKVSNSGAERPWNTKRKVCLLISAWSPNVYLHANDLFATTVSQHYKPGENQQKTDKFFFWMFGGETSWIYESNSDINSREFTHHYFSLLGTVEEEAAVTCVQKPSTDMLSLSLVFPRKKSGRKVRTTQGRKDGLSVHLGRVQEKHKDEQLEMRRTVSTFPLNFGILLFPREIFRILLEEP